MPGSVAEKIIASHLVEGEMKPGAEIGIRIDQTLTQDATGTLVMLELEAMGLNRVQTEVSVQYVDHNLVQEDFKNPDDHLFLRSACRRYGIWYSRPGNGVSHPVHQERFGVPGKTLLGSDSHTCAAGALGMLAIGAGGIEVALAMAGEPFHLSMPEIWGIELVGRLPDWLSAKDVILEMLRRHGVAGGVGRILEYYGSGLAELSAMDRHTIANMGAELGATTSVFPVDHEAHRFLISQDRGAEWRELIPSPDARYHQHERIVLDDLEPLIAMPQSPGNVVPVRDVAGEEIYQAYIGSSANPGYRDLAIAAHIVAGQQVHDRVSFDINPASRQILDNLMIEGHLSKLIRAGARLHQVGCNGCIGMGQAPATGRISLRTVPRNFPGRSGTPEDRVCLVSPETAAASALTGVITDPRTLPRTLGRDFVRITDPTKPVLHKKMLVAPLDRDEARQVVLEKGPNIRSLPELDPLPRQLDVIVLLVVGDDVSTDEILPAGARVLPYRSNIPAISEFVFAAIDESYPRRARELGGAHAVVGGRNYGQGSSREHAALAPRFLGLRLVIARSFARIHHQNLVNFGVLPITIPDQEEHSRIQSGDRLLLSNLPEQLRSNELTVVHKHRNQERTIRATHRLSSRELEVVRAGGITRWKSATL